MADFVAVLKKTIDGLVDPTPQMRERVYEKARATVGAKLAAINPPPPAAAVERQRRSLEDAIRQVEAEYAQAPAAPARPADPIDELENVFASLNASRTADASPRPAPPAPADTARHAPAAAPAMRPQPAQPAAPRPQPSPAPIPAPSAQPEPAEFEPSPAMQQDDYQDHGYAEEDERLPRRRGYGGLIAAVVILALLAGGGYAAWLKRDELQAMLPLKGLTTAAKAPAANTPAKSASATAPAANPAEQQAAAPTPAAPQAGTAENSASATAPAEPEAPAAAEKLTQRLKTDGSEVDDGPAATAGSVGEGTSVAAVTPPSDTAPAPSAGTATPPAAEPQAPAAPAAPPVTANPTPPQADTAPADGANPPADGANPPADAQTATPPAGTPLPGTPATADNGQPSTAPALPPAAGETTAAPDAAAPADQTAAATPPDAAQAPQPTAPVTPASPPDTAANPGVGQKAIFYEERTNLAQGSADMGSIVWSVVQESPGGDMPPEPAIRAEATIPGKDLQLRMTIRRNGDPTLPASHIIEMIFLTPEGFEGGGIENILRVSLKDSEQSAGNPLLGIPAKIADGFFLVALNDSKAEIDANLTLLRRDQWIDVPLVYKSGRRALITMEKGTTGAKVFDETMKAWEAKSAKAG